MNHTRSADPFKAPTAHELRAALYDLVVRIERAAEKAPAALALGVALDHANTLLRGEPLKAEHKLGGIYNPFRIEIPPEAWEPTGPDGDERLRLLTQISINGHAFHAEAYRVTDSREQDVDGDYFEQEWRGICMLQDVAPYQTMTIGGAEYVVVISPHSD